MAVYHKCLRKGCRRYIPDDRGINKHGHRADVVYCSLVCRTYAHRDTSRESMRVLREKRKAEGLTGAGTPRKRKIRQ